MLLGISSSVSVPGVVSRLFERRSVMSALAGLGTARRSLVSSPEFLEAEALGLSECSWARCSATRA